MRKPLIAARAKANQSLSKVRGVKGLANLSDIIDTREELAELSGISARNIHKIEKIIDHSTPELIAAAIDTALSTRVRDEITRKHVIWVLKSLTSCFQSRTMRLGYKQCRVTPAFLCPKFR